jgi:hypothetical protein
MSVQYEENLYEQIPFEKRYDKKTDMVVTERAVYIVGKN